MSNKTNIYYIAVDNTAENTVDNPTGRNVCLFSSKPIRDILGIKPHWALAKSPYDVIHLGYDAFPELSWDDEPLAVNMNIQPIDKK